MMLLRRIAVMRIIGDADYFGDSADYFVAILRRCSYRRLLIWHMA